ncbi:c-type cytochrome biogenesis protein CcsB [Oligella ureolytica]
MKKLSCSVRPLPLFGVGWLWRPLRTYMVTTFVLSAFAVLIYSGDLSRGDTNFFLKYFVSSQSAVLWMCALYFMSTITYWLGFANKNLGWMGPAFAWSGTVLGSVGLLVRWRESHLIAFDMGHIPVSNLYEVFVLFCLITVLVLSLL